MYLSTALLFACFLLHRKAYRPAETINVVQNCHKNGRTRRICHLPIHSPSGKCGLSGLKLHNPSILQVQVSTHAVFSVNTAQIKDKERDEAK